MCGVAALFDFSYIFQGRRHLHSTFSFGRLTNRVYVNRKPHFNRVVFLRLKPFSYFFPLAVEEEEASFCVSRQLLPVRDLVEDF
jgi:hypothetical protein